MNWSRSELRQAARRDWRQYLPILDSAMASDWPAVRRSLREPGFPCDEFLAFLIQQDVAAPLHWMIKRDEASSYIPGWLQLQLIGHAGANAQWGERLMQHQREIQFELRAGGIEVLMLKGLHFAQRYYGALPARVPRDLDILIRPGQQTRACQVIQGLGYQRESQAWLPLSFRNRLAHAIAWHRENVFVDLHHGLRTRPGYSITTESIFAAAQDSTLDKLEARIPSDEHSLLLLMVSIASDMEQARVRMKNLVDFQVLMSQLDARIDWLAWLAARNKDGVLGPLLAVFELMKSVLPKSLACPEFDRSMKTGHSSGQRPEPEQAIALLSAPEYSLANRRWFMGHYEGNKAAYLSWWLIGGLFRSGSLSALTKSLMSSPER